MCGGVLGDMAGVPTVALMPCLPAWPLLQAALPAVRSSLTLTGACNNEIYGGRCMIDAKALGGCLVAWP